MLDLFSGLGGASLGLHRAGMETVAACEISPYARDVYRRHFPEVRIYEDVRELSARILERDGIAVSCIWASWPCQDISTAGARKGLEGERSGLWSEVARLIRELGPDAIVLENVTGLLSLGMGDVLGDLASLGYDADWGCVRASDVGAPHERDRVFIVAYPPGFGQSEQGHTWAHAFREPPQRAWETTDAVDVLRRGTVPVLCREHDGVSHRMERLTALGNSVIPAIVEQIGRAIMQAEAA